MKRDSNFSQISLDLMHQPSFLKRDLVVSDSNKEAFRLIDSWPNWPSPVTILVGPVGAGKSHLASIWKICSHATFLSKKNMNIDSPLEGPFLIEDVDAGEMDETAMFHLINHVQAMHSNILLTSRLLPSFWNIHLPDLQSRLNAAAIVEIKEPDDALLSGVLKKLFSDRQIPISSYLIDYLLLRMERSLSWAISFVDILDKYALERKAKITRSLIAETLHDPAVRVFFDKE